MGPSEQMVEVESLVCTGLCVVEPYLLSEEPWAPERLWAVSSGHILAEKVSESPGWQ